MPLFYKGFPRTFLLAALVMTGGGQTISAADLGSGPPPPLIAPASAWTFTFTPYGWLTALDGDVTVKGRSVDINVDAFEVLGHLDAAPWMSYSEARRGPLTLYSDSFYAKLGIDGSVSRSVRGLSVGADADADIKLTIIELGAAYEVARWRSGGGGSIKDANVFERTTAIDLLAGARYWHQDLSLKFDLTGTLDLNGVVVSRNRAIARSGDVDWVDPLVGVQSSPSIGARSGIGVPRRCGWLRRRQPILMECAWRLQLHLRRSQWRHLLGPAGLPGLERGL